jgi:hypothetical protein
VDAFWRATALVVVGVHFLFLGYVIVGGFIAWRWPRTIALHALAAAWGLLIVVVAVPCPLTALQNQLRELGGQRPLSGGFIDTYVTGRLYPAGAERPVQVVVGVVVLVSWIGVALRRRATTPREVAAGASPRV